MNGLHMKKYLHQRKERKKQKNTRHGLMMLVMVRIPLKSYFQQQFLIIQNQLIWLFDS